MNGLEADPRRFDFELTYQFIVCVVKRLDMCLDLSVQHHLLLPIFLLQDVTRLVYQVVVIMILVRVPNLIEWLTVEDHLAPLESID